MQKIVSANYIDRKSPFKWLVRGLTDAPETATAFKVVTAKNVEFKPSGHYESGFGCRIIASCGEATGFNVTQKLDLNKLTRLEFDGYWFIDPKGKIVQNVDLLHLDETGAMWAAIPDKKSKTKQAKVSSKQTAVVS